MLQAERGARPATTAGRVLGCVQPAPPWGRVLGRAAALAVTALVLAALVLPWRPPTLCLLRGLTGIPCPVCGGTTALVQLGRGDPLAALATSPLVVLGAPAWVLWPWLAPVLGRWRAALGRRSAPAAVVTVAVLSELWQLHRAFG